MTGLLILILIIAGCVTLYQKYSKKYKTKVKLKKEAASALFEQYGLTTSEIAFSPCLYIGGHPERDNETKFGNTLFGVKSGKILFFEYAGLLLASESFEAQVEPPKIKYLFDIPVDSIEDIRYFDATTKQTLGLAGGSNWAIPIKMTKGEASVLVDWKDGKFYHSTEFRFKFNFVGANEDANKLRNTLIRMSR